MAWILAQSGSSLDRLGLTGYSPPVTPPPCDGIDMGDRPLRYPGASLLAEVVAATQSLEAGPTPEDLVRWTGRLQEASERGLSFEGWKEAARTFFLLLQDAIDREGRPLDLPESLVSPALDAATRIWLPLVPLLPADDRVQAWNLLDLLHANRVHRHFLEAAFQAAEAFVRAAPLPAVQSALQLVRRTLEMGPRDERLPPLLDLLDRWCGSEADLAFVHEVRSGLEVRYLDAASRTMGMHLDDLRGLWALHEEITEVLGGELVAREAPAGSSRAVGESREAARVLTARAVAVQGQLLSRDTFVDDWIEFEMARIEAGTGEYQTAIRILERLVERGVFPLEAAQLRARLALMKRYPEDARSVIERAAAVLPLVRRDDALQEPIRAVYREAGGAPDALGLAEPSQSFVDRAQANRDDLAARALVGMEAEAERAFWEARRARLDALLGGLLEGADFDAALGEGAGGRDVRFPVGDAAGCALDDMPGLPEGLRQVLLEAVAAPVPARRVAVEFLPWFDAREAEGRSFDDLVRSFPGMGQSVAVARRRLDAAIQGGNPGAVVALLDHYESLPGVPDRLLLEAWERTRETVGAGPRWLENVRRGRRIWMRLRGEPGRRCGDLVRQDALNRLEDESARGAWEELCAAVLDTMPDDDTRERLWTWFQSRFQARTPTDAMLRLGALLVRRIGPPFEAHVRAMVRDAVIPEVGALVRTDRPEENRETIERLLDVSGGDPAVQNAVVEWFLGGRADGDGGPGAQADLGEWLASRLQGDAAERVRRKTGQFLVSMLQASPDSGRQVAIMERLNTLQPGDPELARMLRDARTTAASYRRIAVYIGLGALVSVALLWLLLK